MPLENLVRDAHDRDTEHAIARPQQQRDPAEPNGELAGVGAGKLLDAQKTCESRGPDADLGTTKAPLRGPLGSVTWCFAVGLHRIELWTSSLSGIERRQIRRFISASTTVFVSMSVNCNEYVLLA